jgi:5'(3')-deoxyribonucleotidase
MKTLYLDMDGVVADWETAARRFMDNRQVPDINGRWPDGEWHKIRDNRHFYRDLPMMPGAEELITLARQFRDQGGWRLCMLTAIPHNNDMPDVYHDKIDWMRERWPEIRVHFGPYSHDKQVHCQPGDILVDDRPSNIAEWQAQGGIGIEVKNRDLASAIELLRSHFAA